MTFRSPRVSIVMPMYNAESYLGHAIESVLAQKFSDFELLISDNASNDESLVIANSFSDSRIRVIKNDYNLGLAGNWNKCLAEARGEFIKLLPADDVLGVDCVSTQVAALKMRAHHGVALVFCARKIIDPLGRPLFRRGHGDVPARLGRGDILRRVFSTGTNPIGEPGAVLFRKNVSSKVGLFDGARPFVIDLDYWLRLLRYGDAYYLPEANCSFRISRQSTSVILGAKQASQFAQYLERLAAEDKSLVRSTDLLWAKTAAQAQCMARIAFQRLALIGARYNRK
jgi:glycosyltransferase involved in cell wall biosynthesis